MIISAGAGDGGVEQHPRQDAGARVRAQHRNGVCEPWLLWMVSAWTVSTVSKSPTTQAATSCSKLKRAASRSNRDCNKLQRDAGCGDKPVRASLRALRVWVGNASTRGCPVSAALPPSARAGRAVGRLKRAGAGGFGVGCEEGALWSPSRFATPPLWPFQAFHRAGWPRGRRRRRCRRSTRSRRWRSSR
jgi:hypothetical protein